MTFLQFLAVLGILEGSWLGMCLVMRDGSATPKRMALIAVCFAVFISAFVLGAYWSHTDFACHPGQHCFPWGN